MAQIIAYLKFENNCREAMSFYKKCFGGELTFQTVTGSAMDSPGIGDEGQKILHSSLISDKVVLFASEMTEPGEELNSTYLWVNCNNDKEIRSIFAGLSEGGTITAELQHAYWGATFSAVNDKFGIKWYISTLNLKE